MLREIRVRRRVLQRCVPLVGSPLVVKNNYISHHKLDNDMIAMSSLSN